MATAIAARHVCRQWGHGITGHCRPACAEGRPRRRQRPTELEHCSNAVFDGLPAQTIWIKFHPETSGLLKLRSVQSVPLRFVFLSTCEAGGSSPGVVREVSRELFDEDDGAGAAYGGVLGRRGGWRTGLFGVDTPPACAICRVCLRVAICAIIARTCTARRLPSCRPGLGMESRVQACLAGLGHDVA